MNPEQMTVKQKLAFLNKNGWDAKEMITGHFKVEETSDHPDAAFLFGEERVLNTAMHIVLSRLNRGQPATLPTEY